MSVNPANCILSPDGRTRVLAVPPSRGTSVYSPVVFTRRDKEREIGEPELQSVLSQAIWRMFDEARRKLGRRLAVSELDIVLLDARIMSVKIDGFRVMNPLGFAGSKIELEIGQTLAERGFVGDIYRHLPKNERIDLFFHPASAYARLLREEENREDFVLAEFGDGKTRLYRAEKCGGIDYLNDFDWDDEKFAVGIADFINLPPEAGREIVSRYFREGLSPAFSRKLKNIFSDFFRDFRQGVVAALYNAGIKKTAVYVVSRLFGEADGKILHWPSFPPEIRFVSPPENERIASSELEIAETNAELNKIARQRVRWLVAGG